MYARDHLTQTTRSRARFSPRPRLTTVTIIPDRSSTRDPDLVAKQATRTMGNSLGAIMVEKTDVVLLGNEQSRWTGYGEIQEEFNNNNSDVNRDSTRSRTQLL